MSILNPSSYGNFSLIVLKLFTFPLIRALQELDHVQLDLLGPGLVLRIKEVTVV